MEDVYKALIKHFETTPQEELDKEWEELAPLNDIGPSVEEYMECVKRWHEIQGDNIKEC